MSVDLIFQYFVNLKSSTSFSVPWPIIVFFLAPGKWCSILLTPMPELYHCKYFWELPRLENLFRSFEVANCDLKLLLESWEGIVICDQFGCDRICALPTMKKIEIIPKIVDALGLTENERRVFDVLLIQTLGSRVSRIAREAKLPRTTVFDALKRLQKRRLVERVTVEKRIYWKYKKGLEFMRVKFQRWTMERSVWFSSGICLRNRPRRFYLFFS